MTPAKLFLFLGALNAFLAVGLGAFGAHALKAKLSADLLAVYHTAAQYHLVHALGLIGIGLAVLHSPAVGAIKWAGWAMLLGIILFSGSLYALSLTGIRGLGAITPLGGLSFLIAWALFAFGALKM